MYRVGICDDSSIICSYIEQCIIDKAKEENIIIETEVWESGESLLNDFHQNGYVDILFLDIELLSMSGIEVADYIRRQMDDYNMQIIYISGKESYAFNLIKTQPLDFLIKPLKESQIEEAFMLACKLLGKKEDKFEYTVGRNICRIPIDDIHYFNSVGRLVRIVTNDDIKEFYGQLKEIYNRLPNSFYMIHQSYIVNSKYIIKYSYDSVELKNGETLSISKTYRKLVRQRLLKDGDM
ncbi:MAG: LytR/AlgR family response regulator transcription factor [Lachnospiraceae bacterium]